MSLEGTQPQLFTENQQEGYKQLSHREIQNIKNSFKRQLTDTIEYDNLNKLFKKETYDKFLVVLYNNLLEWLVSQEERSCLLDDFTKIKNEYVIDIIIQISMKTEISFIQKLYQDIFIIINNNFGTYTQNLKYYNFIDNCLILSKNKYFYDWFIETTFKFFQLKNKTSDGHIALSIFEMGRKIHSELIINSIFYYVRDTKNSISLTHKGSKELKDTKEKEKEKDKEKESTIPITNKAINNLNYILSWGVYFKNINGNKERINLEINDFIHYIFIDVLNAIVREKNKLKNSKSSSISNNQYYQFFSNFSVITIIAYEFMTLYNLKDEISTLKEMKFDDIIIPRAMFSGLNLDHENNYRILLLKEDMDGDFRTQSLNVNTHIQLDKTIKHKDLALDIWSDYKIFKMIYNNYSPLLNLSILDVNNNEKNKIIKLQKICEECFENKDKKDIFAEELKILYFIYNPENVTGEKLKKVFNNTPVIKTISNMFMITLSLLQDEGEIKYWLNEYERFLNFVIISASNCTMKSSNDEQYMNIQEITIDVVTFGLAFLLDEYYNSRKDSQYKSMFT